MSCLQHVAESQCPPGVEALFCQEVSTLLTLRLAGVRIDADVEIFEIWTCGDPECLTLAIDQDWSGTVTRARGWSQNLAGAPVSGGGTAVFDATTFEALSLDEVLFIG